MFICNFKINKKKIWKFLIILLIILTSLLLIFAVLNIFGSKNYTNASGNKNKISSNSNVIEIKTDEYTNFLKDCHENIDGYIGKSFKITGYVYKLPDFSKSQFVLARTMIIDDRNTAVVVGILCENNSNKEYESGSWLEATGTIKKGNYNGEIPILEINNIKTIKAPEDEFVYMPVD